MCVNVLLAVLVVMSASAIVTFVIILDFLFIGNPCHWSRDDQFQWYGVMYVVFRGQIETLDF